MNNYFQGHFIRPCLECFAKHDIDYRASDNYLPIFDLVLDRDDVYLPIRGVMEWTEEVAKKNKIEHLHYKVTKSMGTSFLPHKAEKEILNQPFLLKGLETFFEYVIAGQNDIDIFFDQDGENGTYLQAQRKLTEDKADHWSVTDWYSLWCFVHIVRHYLDNDWNPTRVELSTYAPLPDEIKKDMPSTDFILGKGYVRIYIKDEDLYNNMPQGYQNQPRYKVNKFDLKHSIETVLEPIIDHPDVSIELAAKLLDKQVRSLQRELKTAGYQFREILSGLRCQLALKLLLDNEYSVKEIAEKVGYTKSTNFTRAFKGKYGVLPKDFNSLIKAKAVS